MKHIIFSIFLFTIVCTASLAHAEILDNEEVIDLLKDSIFDIAVMGNIEGKLTINGERRGACDIASSLDDNHFGHVFRIIQDDNVISYATIWSRKSRLNGRIQRLSRNREIRVLVDIDNGSSSVKSETINMNRRGKRLSIVIAHKFANDDFRNVTCVIN